MTLTRKRRKRRPNGTGCQLCRGRAYGSLDGLRLCVTHYADRLVGNAVRERDGGACRMCGAPPPEGTVHDWAHVQPRDKHATRWRLENAVTLCRRDHWAHGSDHRAEWEQWCRDQGIDWDGLRVLALSGTPERPEDVIARFTSSTGEEHG